MSGGQRTPCPARSVYKLQAQVLAEVKGFDRAGRLRHVETVRGEAWAPLQVRARVGASCGMA